MQFSVREGGREGMGEGEREGDMWEEEAILTPLTSCNMQLSVKEGEREEW